MFYNFCLCFKSFADSQTIAQPFNLVGAPGLKVSSQVDRYLSKKMPPCQVYSFMPGVVIELTTSALQGLSERTAKPWDRLGKSYSITPPVDK